MIDLNLLRSTAVLFALAFSLTLVRDRYLPRSSSRDHVLLGLKYGLISLIAMFTPLVVTTGIHYDARNAFVAIAALFGGPVGGSIAFAIPALYRAYLGGAGMTIGLVSLLTAFFAGLGFHFLFKRLKRYPSWLESAGIGFVVTGAVLFWASWFPEPFRHEIIFDYGIAIVSVHILATVAFSALEIESRRARNRIASMEERQRLLSVAQRIGKLGFCFITVETLETQLSASLREILGPTVPRGRPTISSMIDQYVHPDDRIRAHSIVAQIQRGEVPEESQQRVRMQDGTERIFGSYFIGYDKTNARRQAIFLMQDITDRSHLVEQLSHNARLATIGETATRIGHEIMNPLTAARLLNERARGLLAQDQPDFSSIRLALGKVEDRLGTITSLVRSISEFARKKPETAHPVSIHEVIYRATDLFSDLAAGSALRISIDLSADNDWVMGSALHFQQILLNIFSNARQATLGVTLPQLDVCTENKDHWLIVSLKDNGIGMTDEAKQKLFDPFFTTKEQGQGTGLGMSITKSLIENAGGKIEFESTLGEGTEFKIFLPSITGS